MAVLDGSKGEKLVAAFLQSNGFTVRSEPRMGFLWSQRPDLLVSDRQGRQVAIEIKTHALSLTGIASLRNFSADRVVVLLPPDVRGQTAASVEDYADHLHVELQSSDDLEGLVESLSA